MFFLKHHFLLFLVTLGGVTISEAKRESPCRLGWIPVGSRCLMVGRVPLQRHSAERYCESLQPTGQLMKIYSQAEQDIVLQILMNSKLEKVWIGMKLDYNSEYHWDDWSEVVYTNWRREPNKLSSLLEGDSVVVQSPNGKWHLSKSDDQLTPLCMASALPETRREKCSGDHSKFTAKNNSCYLLVKEKETWQKAERYCRSQKSHLVTVKNSDENNYIWLDRRLNEVSSLWIGLLSEREEEFSVWSDNAPAFFWNWGDQEPFHTSEDRCIALSVNVGKWFVAPCDETRAFICEHVLGENIWKIGPYGNGRCPNSKWRDFGGSYCYYYGSKKKITWHGADHECRKMNASLLSIHDQKENKVLAQPLETSGSAWIGFLDTFHSGPIWSDWTDLDYKPDYQSSKKLETQTRCGVLDGEGKWLAIDCHSRSTHQFICKAKKR